MASLLVSCIGFLAALYAWFRPSLLESKLCWLLIFVSSLWNLSYSMEILSEGIQTKLYWCSFKYASGFSLPIILLLYILQFMEIKKLTTKGQILLATPSATAALVIFTKMYEGMPWVEISLVPDSSLHALNIVLGVGYQLIMSYNYLIIGVIVLMLMRVIKFSHRLYSNRLSALSVFLVVPWIAHMFFVTGVSPNNFDFSPFISNLAAVIVVWLRPESLYLEDVLPAARESIVDGMLDAVLLLNGKREILDLNPAAQRLSGLTKSEVLGKQVCEVWPTLCREVDFDSVLVNQELNLDLEGEERIFDLSISTIKTVSNDISSLIVVLRDITELKHYSEQLERLVETRTNQLRNAERLATIGETATMVGHDLRNPLQVLVGYLYILKNLFQDDENPPLTEDVMAILDILTTQSGYMNKIVSDLQDYARPISVQFGQVSLDNLFNKIMASIDHTSVKISTDFQEGNLVWADVNLLRRIFTNLLSNAVQAMPDGGRLYIASSVEGPELVISIQDTGVGIPKENMDKLFKPLFTTKSKGTGFGLAVCKRLVQVHNGSIKVESEVGVGTTFHVFLPLHNDELDYANMHEIPVEDMV